MSHYLTQNSNIRAPLCWEADILQMAITYQLGFGKRVYSFVPYSPHLVVFGFCFVLFFFFCFRFLDVSRVS